MREIAGKVVSAEKMEIARLKTELAKTRMERDILKKATTYLAVVIDLFSRQVVGFAMSERMTRQLVIDVLRMAWFRRRPTNGLIFHSDRGSQYASGDFQKQLVTFGMKGSMSRKGDCWDNAVTETLFGSLKVERMHGMHFATRRQAKDEVIDSLQFYNHRRLHSMLGYLSPMAFEKKRLADKERLAA